MMRYCTPKIKPSVIAHKHARYFTSGITSNGSRVFMGIRVTQDESLLYSRFIAASCAAVIERTEKFAVDINTKVRLAIRYRMFLEARQQRSQQTYWSYLIGYFRAFALGEKYINPVEPAKIRATRVDIKQMVTLSKSALKVPAKVNPMSVSVDKVLTRAAPAISKVPVKLINTVVPRITPTLKPVVEKPAPRSVTTKLSTASKDTSEVNKKENVLAVKVTLPIKTASRMDRAMAELEIMANTKPEDMPDVYSSRRAIMSGERKMPANTQQVIKSKSKKTDKDEIDPALTALIEKARARGKRTSSFLSPEEIPYLIKDSQVHKTVLFLGTSYMFYNYPSTIYYTAYIVFAYFVYLCVSRYNKYMVWISKDFEYAKFLSWSSEAYQRDLHRRMQARYPHKIKKPVPTPRGKN